MLYLEVTGIKTLNDLSRIGSHNQRTKDYYKSNPDIRIEDSKNNGLSTFF